MGFLRAWVALLLGLALRAEAQPQLVVKVSGDSPKEVVSVLGGVMSKNAPAVREHARLFEQVDATNPVFPEVQQKSPSREPLSRVYILSVADSVAFEAALSLWRSVPFADYVIPNRRYRLDAVAAVRNLEADRYLDSLQHLVVTRVVEAWKVTTGHPEVRIGFVDTGVWFDHPDLSGQFWVNPGEDLNGNGVVDSSDFDGVDSDGNGYVDDLRGYDFVDRSVAVEPGDLRSPDSDPSEDAVPSFGPGRGHGTYVAGVLGAARNNELGIAGVAPGSRLLPLRAFANDGEGEDDDVARAIVYAADMGVEVLNLSFGDAYYSPLMHDAIRYATASGTVIVASAGNDGGDWPHYPSDYPEVISVGWLSEDGTDRGFRASHGVNLDVGAPGTRVFTTLFPANEDSENPSEDRFLYGRRSGSSVAAPIVSGIAALVRSMDPTLTPEAVRAVLSGTATDIREPGWDQWTGAGRVDALAAVTSALPARVEIRSPVDEAGLGHPTIPILGSALSPLFDWYELSYALGDDEPDGKWVAIGSGSRQVMDDTLGVWVIGTLPDTTAVLRLSVHLKNGRHIEDRRRVSIDRTPPRVGVVLWDVAWKGGQPGVFAELVTDDFTEASMTVEVGGLSTTVRSDRFGRRGRRHGLVWTDPSGKGGPARSTIEVINGSGLRTTLDGPALRIPEAPSRLDAVSRLPLSVPAGYLMPQAVDFDQDGLLEIVFNQNREGALGDTLAFFEWSGSDFSPMGKMEANVFPRAVGDTDGDGLLELLTQVSAVTLLLEQPGPRELPTRVAFLDTTGIGRIDDDGAVWGTSLTDVDKNGRGEILSHNRKSWRLLEWDGSDYREVVRLINPTPIEEARRSGELDSDLNGFSLPRALQGDFDGDGLVDVLVGDTDGDFIMFECRPGPLCDAVWTYETDRYNAGSRFAAGDFDGDGRPEVITYTDGWRSLRQDREYEAEYGIYYRFEAEGDNTYVLQDSLTFVGPVSSQGSVFVVDVDEDGRDELGIVYPPDLYVFRREGDEWRLAYHWGDGPDPEQRGARSIFVVAADFDEDGVQELVMAGADDTMHLLDWDSELRAVAPPMWVEAHAINDTTVFLQWHAPAADSVMVWRGTPGEEFDPILTTASESVTIVTKDLFDYALSAWSAGERSGPSEVRRVRPHASARLLNTARGPGDRLVLTFSESLSPKTDLRHFSWSGLGKIRSVVLESTGRLANVEFSRIPLEGDTLSWTGLRDVENTPVPDGYTLVPEGSGDGPKLVLAGWRILDAVRAELVFSGSLDPGSASDPDNYRVLPAGSVSQALWDPLAPERVILVLSGRILGAVGSSTTIVVTNVRSSVGHGLATEGNVATLSGFAGDLSDVFVYPNPCRVSLHGEEMTIAGLPGAAEIEIFSPTGKPLRTLVETDGDGGVQWNLLDDQGESVPSGVYLMRVSAEGFSPVLIKAALIR